MIHHKIFVLPKPLLVLLLLSNIFFAIWLKDVVGGYTGWSVVDLSNDLEVTLPTVLAVAQFALFALSIDMLMRSIVTSINRKLKVFQIPSITVTAMSIGVYAVVGLIGFILLYDHSLSHILAAAGALGLGVAYAGREWIADVTASIQIQTDHLASINDYLEVSGEKDLYRVAQIDHRMITIEDKFSYLIRIPARQFLTWQYINISKQPKKRGARRRCSFGSSTVNSSNRVLEMMNTVMRYLIAKDSRFYDSYDCQIQKIEAGVIEYVITYECDPSLGYTTSTDLVFRPLIHVLNAAAISFNSDIEILRPRAEKSDIKQKLLDIYRYSILKVLSEEQIVELSGSIRSVQFEHGDQIIKIGEQAQSMYFISEGHLEVGIPGKDGKDLIVASLWPGDCVGEMSLLTGEPRSANVYAKSNGLLLEISRDNLAPFFKQSPKLIEQISKVLSDRRVENEKALQDEGSREIVETQMKALIKRIALFFFGAQ